MYKRQHDGTDAVFIMDQIKDEKNVDESWLESISLKEAISRLGAVSYKHLDVYKRQADSCYAVWDRYAY